MNPKRSNRTLVSLIAVMGLIGIIVISNVLFTMITQVHFRSGENVKAFRDPAISNKKVLKANRGTIYDRSGTQVIAQDEVTYNIILYTSKTRKEIGGKDAFVSDIDKTAKGLAPKLDMSEDAIRQYLKDAIANNQYQTELGTKGKNLSGSVKESIDKLELTGVGFEKTIKRNYPNGKFASHLIGYAQYDEEEKRITGKMGLEGTLDDKLKGSDGVEVYQKDVYGNMLPGTSYIQKYAENGDDVILTLDENVQLALETALRKTVEDKSFGSQKAWGIIMEVETGKILGYASYPTFDLNKRDMSDYVDVPANYLFEPGSTMKAFTYAAALDSGTYPYNKTYNSGIFNYGEANGKIFRSDTPVPGYSPIEDAERKNHGTLTFDKGFILSSNIAICELMAKYMDPNIYKEYIDKFGFMKPVGIPFVENQVGKVNFTYASEKLSTGFGQSLSVNALQMVQAYSAIFNDGKMMQPYLVDRIEDGNSHKVLEQYSPKQVGTPISQKTSDYMKGLMKRVVSDDDGTAHNRYRLSDISMLAKTGTGQISRNGTYGQVWTNSVIAAAPADDPKIMFYYVFEGTDLFNFTGEYFKEAFKEALVAANITGDKQTTENKKVESEWKEYKMPGLVNHTTTFMDEKLKNVAVNKVVIGNGTSIVKQYPVAEETIISGQNVFILTDGSNYKMPNMVGWTKKDLTVFWEMTGIVIEMEGNGVVKSQNIEKDKPINIDTEIKVKLE